MVTFIVLKKKSGPPPDLTAPVLSAPTGTPTGINSATVQVTTDEFGSGRVYWVVTTSATAPSKAQVKAGQDHTGSAAAAAGSWSAPGDPGTASASATGLADATTYYAHFMHEDAAANQSDVVSSASFDTLADVVPGNQTFTASGNFTVPDFNLLRVYVRGPGGGGGGGGISSNYMASDGTPSSFNGNVIANGGKGAQGNQRGAAKGVGGTATGGDTNTPGDDGANGTFTGNPASGFAQGGKGGDGADPGGGPGGPQTGPTSSNAYGIAGTAPGGGGSGGVATGPGGGGGGGGGALAIKEYTRGDLAVGAGIPVVVGTGGPGGSGWRPGGAGARGEVYIEWE